jgi:hypothetical protein
MFFRRKAVGERSYLQIVESRRDGRSVRQHVVATLGRAEDWLDSGTLDQLLAVRRAAKRNCLGVVGAA